MTIKHTVTKGRSAAVKGIAAYAAAKKGVDLAKQTANRMAHEWSVEQTYAEDLFYAAMRVAAEHQVPTPGARRRQVTGNVYAGGPAGTFTARQWTMLRGIAPGVQARKQINGNTIEFRAFRVKDIEALEAEVKRVRNEMEEEECDITVDFEPASWTSLYAWSTEKNAWDYNKDRQSRSFSSVLIPDALQQEIEADLKRFSDSRERLTRLEMPWRRGYLLSGPPGTGKTSLSLAIAGALGFNLATLSLTDLKSDGALRKAVSSLPGRTVLVIEDIDANAVSHERDHNAAQDGALSLSGLLNSLDGFETPEGLVTILTTNHIDRLDAALVRSGRMDRTFHLGHIEARELERLFEWFYEQPVPSPAPEQTGALGVTPAEAAELFKQHLDDPEGGWQSALDHINANTLHIAA